MQLNKLRSIHGKFYEWKKRWGYIFSLIRTIKHSNPKTLLYIMTPIHGNIGDLAIAKATSDFLSDMNLEFIEATTEDLKMFQKIHSLGVLNNRRILVHGGGYFGTIWPDLDSLFMRIVKKVPNSKILCFPNTIYYENTPEGQAMLKESAAIFNNHKSIKICARENISYDMVRNLYNDVVLIPDMVLSMNESEKEYKRSGCLICFRNDLEKTLTSEEIDNCKMEADSLFDGNVRKTDINEVYYIPVDKRNSAIQEKLDEFKSAELVITDRLHGMIFSAITGTPCIVLNCKSHKIKGSYEWIKHLDYIILSEKGDNLSQLYRRIPKKRFHYDNKNLQPYYAELKECINNIVN